MSTPGKLIFIRHAETAMAGTFCGHSDPPLNQAGLDQLPHLIAALRSYAIKRVYTSDLQRAARTARRIAGEFVTTIDTNINLREIGFGEWEGLNWAEIEARDFTHAREWMDQYPNLSVPKGEPYAAFRDRVLGVVEPLLKHADEGDIAVVTHAGVLQLVLTAHCGYTAEQAWATTRPYCSFFPLDRRTR